jgi:hypothetical protein
MSAISAPRYVVADALWYYGTSLSLEEKAEVAESINTVWSPELESIWEPSITIDMNQWLDDHCIVSKWRQYGYESWAKLCDPDCIYPVSVYGISPCKFNLSKPTYSVFVKNLSKFTTDGDILFTLSAIAGDAEIIRYTRPKFPNGQNRGFVIVEYASEVARNRALDWSKRILLDDSVVTIEEKK